MRNRLDVLGVLGIVLIALLALGMIISNVRTPAPVIAPAATSTPVPTVCGETTVEPQSKPVEDIYTTSNSPLKTNLIRTLAIRKGERWIGYGGVDGLGGGNDAGVGLFDGKTWRFCVQTSHVNAISFDGNGLPWVGTDAKPGVGALLQFDGQRWVDYTSKLPDYRVYALVFHEGILYVGTYEGIVQFDGKDWTVPKVVQDSKLKDLIIRSHIHVIAFSHGDMWLGTIAQGLIRIAADGTTEQIGTPVLGGNMIRSIIESPSGTQILVGQDGGGLDVYDYATGQWSALSVPNKRINGMIFDGSGQLWLATAVGAFFFDRNAGIDNGSWNPLYGPGGAYIAYCVGLDLVAREFYVGTNQGLLYGSIVK